MQRIFEAIRALGRKTAISAAAESTLVSRDTNIHCADNNSVKPNTTTARATKNKLDHYLDLVVSFSGSPTVFLAIFSAVITWALLGIPFGSELSWAVTISNVQAIICYIQDSLLTRHLLTGYEDSHLVFLDTTRMRVIIINICCILNQSDRPWAQLRSLRELLESVLVLKTIMLSQCQEIDC